MSKKMRVWMTVGGILLAIGLVLGLVGLAMGAWNYRDQWTVSVHGNRFGLWLDDDGNANLGLGEEDSGQMHEIASYDSSEDVRVLKVNADVSSITIQRGDQYRLQVGGKMAETVTNSLEDGTWQITQKSKNSLKNTSGSSATVIITIPEEVTFEKISCELGVGELDAERLAAEEIDLESGVGDLTVDGVQCTELSVSCGTGSADIGASAISENAYLENGIGDLTLILEGTERDYNYDISCGMGSIRIGNLLDVDGMAGDQTVDQKKDCWIRAESGMGDVTIDFTENSVQ